MSEAETVDCVQVHRALREPVHRALDEPALQAHLRACSACAELAADFEGISLGYTLADAEGETAPRLSLDDIDAMYEHVEQQLRRPAGGVERLRQSSTRARALALSGVAIGVVALVLVTMRRVDLALYPLPRLLGAVASLVAAVLAAGAVVLRPLHRRPLPSWLLGVLAGFAVVAPAVIASLPAAHRDHPSALLGTGDDLVGRALGCFVFGMAFALVLVGAAWLVERSGLRRRAAAVLGLVGAGALGNLVLVLHCPMVEPIHKLAGHATVSVVLLAAAGALAWAAVRRR